MDFKTILILALCLVYIIVPHRIDVMNFAATYSNSEETKDRLVSKIGISCFVLAIVPMLTFSYVFASKILRVLFP